MLGFYQFLQEGRAFQGSFTNPFYRELVKLKPKPTPKLLDMVNPYAFNKELGAYDNEAIAKLLKVSVEQVSEAYKAAVKYIQSLGLFSISNTKQGVTITSPQFNTPEHKFKTAVKLSSGTKISAIGGYIYLLNHYFMVELYGDAIKKLVDSPFCVYVESYKDRKRIYYKPKENFVVVFINYDGDVQSIDIVDTKPNIPKDKKGFVIYDLEKGSVIDHYNVR